MSHVAPLLESLAQRSVWGQGKQQTLAIAVERSGIGLHSGLPTQVRLAPAETGRGRYFVRTDLPGAPKIPAQVDAVRQTMLSTELAYGEASVRTVEHLLAALAGLGIDNAQIEINGAEVPLLDGSALGWVEAIAQAGIQLQASDRPQFVLSEPIWIRQEDAFVAALPSPELRFTYGIDFDLPAIGNQWHSWSPLSESSQESFAETIAPARTFGLAHQIEQLQQNGLIKGGSLENALVCGKEGWINPPLRFSNEPVRHKLLDLVGDLSLLGVFPQAHVLAYKASHALHVQLAQHLAQVFQTLQPYSY
ncbi:MAG: UDP-3-O-acyl-N-acetylglucosamine deacetylase [Drouetiella hepatica Uher 2000/2452]|jgi:UDP-3-O-[3-hydroxymyristoyl] N-acetylglucosamine deacetylase|uniref:UDP-3-O-acyl-N-acetylglucosamine deacetylase n=1 Tax=Drouetiella hepatica Uher 2000/2452 TaxID=904376 RepID=A0A951QEN6_9CYAN|nr:UDP-3-O-acyl-N-acetylglucosamine deacetylase [Drouetiella hepatica Uher 2000/2452]